MAYSPLKSVHLYLQNGCLKWQVQNNFLLRFIKNKASVILVLFLIQKACKLHYKLEWSKLQSSLLQQNHFHKKILTALSRKVLKDSCLLYKLQRKITSKSEDMFQWLWDALIKVKLSPKKSPMLPNNCLIWAVMKYHWEILLVKELHKKL